jgi:ribonuclease P protein component
MRVRRYGKSYAHPLIVLLVLPADGAQTRFGVTAGRSLDNAVQRNRAKRLVREALRSLLPLVQPGWMVTLIARNPILNTNLTEISTVLRQLLLKANLINTSNE